MFGLADEAMSHMYVGDRAQFLNFEQRTEMLRKH
jgi:hypothetical protein